ncbi:DUF6525 family protein [Falsiroseomonas selenitidurans]|uniref:Uncharacterized protein n=1 Tax=Falsiroseomonas selenitidurans TaxID=2716335 RepID=A0ABX1E6Z3_9PROT|nr:DUF6525 family protein [Falsiroseomonas selenitidurans]NKC31557.1 hypothetical protein [Falsiroseomonas selenitidurans]
MPRRLTVADNDRTARDGLWRRFAGDNWAAFDALPAAARRRLQEHAYDPWSVNAARLWRLFLRRTASSDRALRRLLRHIDACEALEREAFAVAHRQRHAAALPHVAAGASVPRYAGRRAEPARPPAGP